MKNFAALLGFCAVAAATAMPACAADKAQARMINAKGEALGTLELTPTPNGVLIKGTLGPLPPGAHGFHIHAVGKCDAAGGFASAGDHFALNHLHGFVSEAGPHPGDMANLHVPESGKLEIEAFNPSVTLQTNTRSSLLDGDGTAIVIHANPDDYVSQPSGNAGPRIACGIIQVR